MGLVRDYFVIFLNKYDVRKKNIVKTRNSYFLLLIFIFSLIIKAIGLF